MKKMLMGYSISLQPFLLGFILIKGVGTAPAGPALAGPLKSGSHGSIVEARSRHCEITVL